MNSAKDLSSQLYMKVALLDKQISFQEYALQQLHYPCKQICNLVIYIYQLY